MSRISSACIPESSHMNGLVRLKGNSYCGTRSTTAPSSCRKVARPFRVRIWISLLLGIMIPSTLVRGIPIAELLDKRLDTRIFFFVRKEVRTGLRSMLRFDAENLAMFDKHQLDTQHAEIRYCFPQSWRDDWASGGIVSQRFLSACFSLVSRTYLTSDGAQTKAERLSQPNHCTFSVMMHCHPG
jgi:hypothetical protein